ncbi:MAG: TIGR01777 family oxidoreductase [Opitutales bacterium]|nr:TIGR01777 family oxidoreductase [Opitutales bacterium]
MEEKIVIFGGGGFIGSALARHFSSQNCKVVIPTRSDPRSPYFWDLSKRILSDQILDGAMAVIKLAGESIFGFWNKSKKSKILSSRVSAAKLIAQKIRRMKNPPNVFINASAVGYYGVSPKSVCCEQSKKGAGFLADVCAQSERAAQGASRRGTRVVQLRQGMVIGGAGGIVKMLSPLFKMFLGAKISCGENYMPWISIADLVRLYDFAISNESLKGRVNAVSPFIATNADFAQGLAKKLHRPRLFRIPKFLMRLIFGQMADEAILSSQIVLPQKLADLRFDFQDGTISEALSQNHNL